MNYEEVLTRALSITWRHKYLWLLALFAGETAAFGLPGGPSSSSGGGTGSHRYGPAAPTAAQVGAWLSAHAGLIAAGALTLVVVAIVLLLVSAVTNGALIRAAAAHDRDESFGLAAAWRAGVGRFWPVLGMKLFAGLVTLAAVIVIGSLALVAVGGAATHNIGLAVAAGVMAGMLLLVAIPFWVVLMVAVLLGQRAIVLDGMSTVAGLRAGFGLIRRRFGRVAVLWILVGVVGLLLGFAVRIAVVIVALPLAGVVAAAYFTGGVGAAIGFGIVLGAIWLALALALLAAVSAYTSTVWTLAYARFDVEPQPQPASLPAPA